MPKFHVIAGPDATPAYPIVRKIGPADLKDALARGIDDFWAIPTSLVFLGLVYPIAGMCLAGYAVPLLFPLMSGFALVGPFAAIGLYEISRRRELGLEASWANAFDVRHSPSIPSLLALGLLLLVIFICWRATAESLYVWLFGPMEPVSYMGFLNDIFTTSRGWTLIVLGNAIGCVFAVVVLSISVISFPLLLDRDVGVVVAILTSLRAVRRNPVTMAIWGLIVAAVLAIGFLLLFVGLAVAVPILAHASWHLYRKVVEPAAPVRRQAVESQSW
ncbi:MAG: DUF2189 domain-containing protein [Pseudomonadota bacterium]|nr:DUF2189 domain-containing protein [Pseudomonadota bacterium]